MFQLEYGNVSNCTFQNLYCNGGGKWYPLYLTNGKGGTSFSQKNLVMKNVKVSDKELEKRRAKWKCPPPKVKTGYLARYAALVSSAAEGAIVRVPGEE